MHQMASIAIEKQEAGRGLEKLGVSGWLVLQGDHEGLTEKDHLSRDSREEKERMVWVSRGRIFRQEPEMGVSG